VHGNLAAGSGGFGGRALNKMHGAHGCVHKYACLRMSMPKNTFANRRALACLHGPSKTTTPTPPMKALAIAMLFLLSITLCPRAQAQIVAWEISGTSAAASNPMAATFLASGLASAQLALGSGVNASAAADTFGASGFNATSLAAAIAANQYLSITFTPAAGQALSLTSLSLQTSVSTAVSSFHAALLSSVTGFTAGDSLHTYAFSTAAAPLQTATLSGESDLQGLTTATEFRLYGWRDATGTSTFRFRSLSGYDVSIAGTVSAVPEPSTWAATAGLVALAGAIAWRRKRRG